MKVFVYSKQGSKKIAEIRNVSYVICVNNKITFTTVDGVDFTFDCKRVKTTTYQN